MQMDGTQFHWKPKRSLRRYFWTLSATVWLGLIIMGFVVSSINLTARQHVQMALSAVPPLRLALRARPSIEAILVDVYRYGFREREDEVALQRLLTVLRLHRTNLRSLMEEYEAWIAENPGHPLQRLMTEALFLLKEADETAMYLEEAAGERRWEDVESLTQHLEILATRLDVRVTTILRVADYQWREALYATLTDVARMIWVPGLVAGGMMILFLVQTVLFQRRVLRPLLQLVGTLQAFAQGNWDVRLPEVHEDEIGLAARVFNVMAEQIQQSQQRLEQQVQERTLALQRRVAQTVAAADIGRLITQERDPERLLQRAAQLIAERFGYYAVNIFLIDESGTWAVMRASSHPGGQRLVQQGFRLRVGEQGLVGYAAHTGRERVVGDVSQDPFYYANPEFPETRSEAVFPLRIGDEVRGVLDVQSTRLHAFQAGELETLHIVVDLLSAALANVELLQRQARTLRELQRTQALMAAEAWRFFTHVYLAPGYRLQGRQVQPLAFGEHRLGEASAPHRLHLPLNVHGRTIAVLELERPATRRWTRREQEMLRILVDRLAIALETARQFTLSQRRLAWMHHIVQMARRPTLRPIAVVTQDLTNFIQETFRWPHVALFQRLPGREEVTQVAGQERWPSPFRMAGWQQTDWARRLSSEREPLLQDRFPWVAGQEGTRLVLPLVVSGQVWGYLEIGLEQPHAFAPADLPILEVLAEQLAAALETASLFEQIENLLQGHQEIHDLVVRLAGADDVETAMTQAVEGVYTNYQRWQLPTGVALYRWDDEQQTLYLHHARPEAYAQGLPIAWVDQDSPPLQALQTNLPQEGRWTPDHPALWEAGYRHMLAVPLRVGGVRIGVLLLARTAEFPFTENEKQIMATLGQVLSAVFHNLALLADLNRRTEEINLLFNFLDALARHTEIQPALQDAARRLREAFDTLHCGITLFEQDDTGTAYSVLVATASREGTEEEWRTWIGVRFPHEDDWAIQTVRQTGKPLLLTRVTEDPRLTPTAREILRKRGTGTLVILPLVVRGQVIGTVGLDFEDPEVDIPPEKLQLMVHMVGELSVTLERLQLLEELNRRAQREHLVREITTRLRATTDPQDVVRVLLQELKQALGAQRVQVLIQRDASAPEDERGSRYDGATGGRA